MAFVGPSSLVADRSAWRFDRIAAAEPKRASVLERAGTSDQLVDAIAGAFLQAAKDGKARFGSELAQDARGGSRIVIQFHVGALVFDWFFNARTGYRAHFRAAPAIGIAFNNRIVALIRQRAHIALSTSFIGRELIGKFEDAGEVNLTRGFLMESLVPTLSKLWWCARRIRLNGGIDQLVTGLVGPRIEVGQDAAWAAPSRDDESAWLDVYGAFIGTCGPYQPKDPIARAEKLHLLGEA